MSAAPAQLTQLLGLLSSGLCLLDEARSLVYCNPWLASRLPVREPWLGRRLDELLPRCRGIPRLHAALADALDSGLSSRLSSSLNGSAVPLKDPFSGQDLTVSVAVHPLRGEDGRALCLLEIIDITVLAEKEKLLRQQAVSLNWQASHDALTGLANRRCLEQRYQELAFRPPTGGRCHGLLVVDIDYFKEINDRLGHSQGDEVLRRIGELLSATVRGSDLPVRLGGDEFAILLLDGTRESAERIAANLRLSVEALRAGLGGGFGLSASVGGLLFSDPSMGLEQALQLADQAMYAAKHSGRAAFSVQEAALSP